MPRVDKGNSRPLQTDGNVSNSSALVRAGAINITTDEEHIWKGRTVGLFSFPNGADEVAYMSVEVTNLDNYTYQLSLEKDDLSNYEGIRYPATHSPTFSELSNPLILRRFTDSSTLSGAMFTIPKRSRVHVALRLTVDRADIQGFSVVFQEHAGRGRESPTIWERPIVKRLEWIPAPSAKDVEVKVFSTPSSVLFWNVNPDPNRVWFRPWNVVPRANRLLWSLPIFHHPECIVRVVNRSSFSASVSPCLVIKREDAEGNAPRAAQKERLEAWTLNPGEGREWPCPLSLSDTRLPQQEADEMRIQAFVELHGPDGVPLDSVEACETLRAEYQPFLTKIIDWGTLIGLFCFMVVFLLWITYGIPVPITPRLDVLLHFKGQKEGDLPPGIDARDPLHVSLSPGDIPGRYDPAQRTFQFKFDRTWVGNRWPFGWRGKEDTFEVVVSDDKNLYQFTPLRGQKLTLFPAPHDLQVLGQIEANPSTELTQRLEANRALDRANDVLNDAVQLLRQHQPAKSKIEEANQFINKADGLLTTLPQNTAEKKILEKAQIRLSDAKSQQELLEKSVGDEQRAENRVRIALANADSSLQAGRSSLNANDKDGATSQLDIIRAYLATSTSQIARIKDPGIREDLTNQLHTTQNALARLQADIAKYVPPVTSPSTSSLPSGSGTP